MRFLDFVEVLQESLVNQIGPCANNDTDDAWFFQGLGRHVIPALACVLAGIYAFQSLSINLFQLLQRLVCIRKWLKISQILIGATIPFLMEFNAFFNLLLNAFLWLAIGGIESGIAAKSATTCTDFPITVGTTESRINTNLLHTPTELLCEVVALTIESPLVAPRESHGFACFVGFVKLGLLRNSSSVSVFKNAFSWAFSKSVSCTPPSITWCISGLMFSESFTPSL